MDQEEAKSDDKTNTVTIDYNCEHKPLQHVHNLSLDNESTNDDRFISKFKNDRIYRGKSLYSVSIWCLFLVFGWKMGQLGPSLLDLQIITGTGLGKISAIFTSGSITYLGGNFFSVYLFRNFNSAILLFISAIGSAVIMAIIPWCFIYETMIIAFAVVGLFDAMVDTVANAELFRIWRTESTLYIQALHFFFTIGAMISPLVTAPFLIPLSADMNDTTIMLPLNEAANCTFGNNGTLKCGFSSELHNTDGNLSNNKTEDISILSNENKTLERFINITLQNETMLFESKLYIAYLITAACFVFTAVFFLNFYINNDVSCFQLPKSKPKSNDSAQNRQRSVKATSILYFFISALAILYTIFDSSIFAFLTVFCVKQLQWSKVSASHLNSVYWATFCFGRFISIWLLKFIKSSKLLLINSILLVIAFIGFLFSSLYSFMPGIWIFIGLSGILMSSMFPTIFTWTDNEVIPVTEFITSLIFSSAAVGAIINPIILGYLMENISVLSFCYMILGNSVAFVFLFLTAMRFSKFLGKGKMKMNEELEISFSDKDEQLEATI